MIEIKIQCGCGAKYKFDVEPVQGRMPVTVQCPTCGADGTSVANEIISHSLPAAPASVPVAIPVRAAASASHGAESSAAPAAPRPPGVIILRIAGANEAAAESSPPADQAGCALLDRTIFFVKERTGFLKLTDTYDILDPASGQAIGIAKEEPPTWAKWLRLAISKGKLPTRVNIYEQEGQPPVAAIDRGFSLFRSKIRVLAGGGQSLGYFRKKFISVGGGFNVFDNQNQQVAEVKGNWKSKEFRFLNKNGREIGTVTKKWAGLGKELFTSADNYVIAVTDLSGATPAASALLLAAGLAIDVVFKEDE